MDWHISSSGLWGYCALVSISWSELMDSWMMWPRMWGIGSLDLMMQTGMPTVILAAGIIALVFGIIALVGGIYAIKRRRWGLALAGAILSIPIQGVMGVLAIIFVSLGKREFD